MSRLRTRQMLLTIMAPRSRKFTRFKMQQLASLNVPPPMLSLPRYKRILCGFQIHLHKIEKKKKMHLWIQFLYHWITHKCKLKTIFLQHNPVQFLCLGPGCYSTAQAKTPIYMKIQHHLLTMSPLFGLMRQRYLERESDCWSKNWKPWREHRLHWCRHRKMWHLHMWSQQQHPWKVFLLPGVIRSYFLWLT